MNARTLRSVSSIAVVIAHILTIGLCALYLQPRITKVETFISVLSVFVPVFGVYVGIAVKSLSLSAGPRGPKVQATFIILLSVLFAAYLSSILAVIFLYANGTIPNEDILPASIAAMEAAFGAYFMTLFLKLFENSVGDHANTQ
jgi:hypothetical protein